MTLLNTFIIYNLVLLILVFVPPFVLLPVLIPLFVIGNAIMVFLYLKNIYTEKGSVGNTIQYLYDTIKALPGTVINFIDPSSPPYGFGHQLTTDECDQADTLCESGVATKVGTDCYCSFNLSGAVSKVADFAQTTEENIEEKGSELKGQIDSITTETPPYSSNHMLEKSECKDFSTLCKSGKRYYIGADCYCA